MLGVCISGFGGDRGETLYHLDEVYKASHRGGQIVHYVHLINQHASHFTFLIAIDLLTTSTTMQYHFITGLFIAGTIAAPVLQEECATGPHIITVRESSAPPNEGFVRDLANEVQSKLSGSDIEDVDYFAWIFPYVFSETGGVKKTREAIENYVEKCPQTDIVLLGYSQVRPTVQ